MSFAQDKKSRKFARLITEERLRSHLEILASDSLEGRETGERGQKVAAEYISKQFEDIGLQPIIDGPDGKSYFQPFPLKKGIWKEIYIERRGVRKYNLKDFLYYNAVETYGEEIIEVVLIKDLDVEPLPDINDRYVAITSGGWARWSDENNRFSMAGAKGFFILSEREDQFSLTLERWKPRFSNPVITTNFINEGPKVLLVDRQMLSWMFDADFEEIRTGSLTTITINADRLVYNVGGENVVGFLEGSERKNETLVISAHYDHLGKEGDLIYNGADDNASGCASIINLAKAFRVAMRKGFEPRRNMLFIAFSGEEKGLLGSEHYVKNPLIPLDETIANLNIDMIGRIDPAHSGNPDYVYLIGSDRLSQDLHETSELANRTFTKIDLDYRYNDINDPNRFYYRSDHYNFAKMGVPIIFYFNGTHIDYHQPTDTIEKIDYNKLTKITKLVFHTAWEIVNQDETIEID